VAAGVKTAWRRAAAPPAALRPGQD